MNRRRHPNDKSQGGYVAVFTAIIMVVLLMMVAFAIDIAFFLVKSNQIQRAVDAAALAGVTYAPDLDEEKTVARNTLAHNGFENGGNITVSIDNPPLSPRQLEVKVRVDNIPTLFGRFARNSTSIEKKAIAEFVAEVPLGSAFNAIGTGSLAGHVPGDPLALQQSWLAVSGYCTAKEDGDQISSRFDGTRNAPDGYTCDPSQTFDPGTTTANTDYSRDGYTYTVQIPCPGAVSDLSQPCPSSALTTAPITIEVYDPLFDPVEENPVFVDDRIDDRTLKDSTHPLWNFVSVTTDFEVLNKSLTRIVPTQTFGTCYVHPCSESQKWIPLVTIPTGSPAGIYYVKVATRAPLDPSVPVDPMAPPVQVDPINPPTSFGTNSFALRAKVGLTTDPFVACTSISGPTPPYDPLCPSVSGRESMGVFVNSSGTIADLFLARLAPAREFRGKRVQVLLWDPGEGGKTIELLAPGGTPHRFDWRTWFPGLAAPLDEDKASGWPTPNRNALSLDVSGDTPLTDGTYPRWIGVPESRYSTSKFNDRLVSMEIRIPTDYGLDASGNEIPLADDGWWKIRYTADPAASYVTDRTTWAVQLIGDPVRLVRVD
jgi:hypothetical protein